MGVAEMKVVYDADGWISVHSQKQHIEFTYPMMSILYGLPGSCWKTLGFMIQNCYRYDEDAADFVRGPRPMAVRFIAEGSYQDPSTVMSALETLMRWRLVLRVVEGAPAVKGRDGEAAVWSVNWHLRVRPVDGQGGAWHIEGVEEPYVPRRPKSSAASVRKIHTPEGESVGKIHTQACGKSTQRSSSSQEEDIYAPAREPVLKPPRSSAPGPSLLELEGYSPEPPTAAGRAGDCPLPPAAYLKRLPGTLERMGLAPDRMRDLAGRAADELDAPGVYTGDRGQAFAHGPKYPLYLWMLNVLAMVCGENLTSGESTALAEPLWRTAREWVDEGRTPPQVWARFGDPDGYWYASEDHGWKNKRPTLTDVGRKWNAAGQPWARRAPSGVNGSGGGPATKTAAADDGGIDGAWSATMRAIRQFGRYRQTEILAALDEITRATVRAVGLGRLMDVDPDDGRGVRDARRLFAAEYSEQRRRVGVTARTQATAAD